MLRSYRVGVFPIVPRWGVRSPGENVTISHM